jgi:hypothetical protein
MRSISGGADETVQVRASWGCPTTTWVVHSDVRSLSYARARPFGMTPQRGLGAYFLRVFWAGGKGRRIGTIAPRAGSLAALARERTSS